MAAATEPEPPWLTLFRQSADPKAVATAWHEGLSPDARKEAKDDAPTARARLRRAIVDSECPEVRAEAATGWKYTATVLRAADEVLGIPPPKSRCWAKTQPGTLPFRPKHVCANTDSDVVKPGGLNLWWSDFDTALQARRLREECGVTRRLNVAIEIDAAKFSADDDALVKTVHIPMKDAFDVDDPMCPEWTSQLNEALETLRAWRAEGHVVNVNCQMGKNRSGAVILMWLYYECGWDLEAAVHHLREITPLACGNPHLLAELTKMMGVPSLKVALNPAADGGGWVCISPPGSPRAGAAQAFDEGNAAGGMEEAANRLAAISGYRSAEVSLAPVGTEEKEGEEVEEADGDMGALFSELSDVD